MSPLLNLAHLFFWALFLIAAGLTLAGVLLWLFFVALHVATLMMAR